LDAQALRVAAGEGCRRRRLLLLQPKELDLEVCDVVAHALQVPLLALVFLVRGHSSKLRLRRIDVG
jgi:hypothetical protein